MALSPRPAASSRSAVFLSWLGLGIILPYYKVQMVFKYNRGRVLLSRLPIQKKTLCSKVQKSLFDLAIWASG